MPLEFPSSPVDGQVYDNWVYSSSKGAWLAKPLEPTTAVTSDTPPANPIDGDMWFNTVDGTTYVWYDDGNTAQWVEMVAPISANGYYSPNYVINGGFDVNQRNFTSTAGNNTYGFDRWVFERGGGSPTHSAQTFTPGAAPVAGYEATNFARTVVASNTLASDYCLMGQRIEDVRTLAGQTATISFWAKSASGTPKIFIEVNQNFGSGGSASTLTKAGTVTISTTWTRYSITINIPSISGKTIGTNSLLAISLWMSAGSDFNTRTNSLGLQNNTFDIWGVQLEEGSVATHFRRNANSLQGELAACQRYYQTWGAGLTGRLNSTTNTELFGFFKVPMRIAPVATVLANITIYNVGQSAQTVTCSINSTFFTVNGGLINLTIGAVTGTTPNHAGVVTDNFALSAEL